MHEIIKIKYLTDDIEKLKYIDGVSDWIDLRSAADTEMKKGEFKLPLSFPQDMRRILFQEALRLKISVSYRQIIWA